ncbi:MAG: type II secretion system F family protein [Phycisphaerae bacterium]|jgi:general secretion pathway protein F
MSVAEYNLISDQSAPTHRPNRERRYIHAEERMHNRDLLRAVRDKDLCGLARQLSTLLRAGLPLVPALSAIVEQLHEIPQRPHNAQLAEIVQHVADNVNQGSTLTDALKKYPDVFSGLFVNMVSAGEASGTLEEVLQRLAEMMEKRVNLTDKVKSAMAYPLMMTVVAVGVVVFLLSFVVPSISQIFLEMNKALPWPTILLISISAFIKTYLVLIAVVIFAIFFGIGIWLRTKEGKLSADRWKLRLPLFGELFLKLEMARLTRTLGILLVSGIPILSALEIARGVIKNSFISAALEPVKGLISKGDTIANAIRKTRLVPPVVFHIIATGQISGDIEAGLISIADMYDREVDMTTKTLTSLLEPAILLVMGVVVGFIVLAILLPIFEINQVL